MKKIGITQVFHLFEKDFDDLNFTHRDKRLMDISSKMGVMSVRELYKKIDGAKIPSDRIGIVFASGTGPISSITDFFNMLNPKGYIGINPGKFPNVMMSTPLFHISKEIQATGPSVAMYISKKMFEAVNYGRLQILRGRCDSVIVLYVNEGKSCFCLALEEEESAKKRNIPIRFLIDKIE